MHHTGFLLSVAVLSVVPSRHLSDHIYQIVTGTFEDSPTFNSTIFAREFKGAIFIVIDSRGSELRMDVIPRGNQERNISLTLGGVTKSSSSKELCGCIECENMMVNFDVAIRNTIVSVTCNRRSPFLFSFDGSVKSQISNNDNNSKTLRIPLAISNGDRRIYVMVGNVGPRKTAAQTIVNPKKDQLIGCVDKFIYNGRNITFETHGSKVRSSCSKGCNSSICNNGSCIERSMATPLCDCRSTALNGRYCNQSLNIYPKGENNTYERTSETKKVYMKVTWKALFPRNHCLVVIASSAGRMTIATDGTHLRVDSSIMDHVVNDGLNFASLNISDTTLIIKSKNTESKHILKLGGIMRFHVGFSGAVETCETFVGAYDIYVYEGQLRQIIQTRETWTTLSVDPPPVDRMSVQQILYILITVGSLVILVVVVIVLYIRSRREMQMHIERITTMSTFTLDNHSRIFSEAGTYGKVTDNCDYESIQDHTENATEYQ